MHAGNGAIFFDAGFEFHQDGMATAVAIKNFFASETDFDGAIEDEGGFGDDDFVIEGITFATEASAVGSGADTNVRGGHVENFGESAMEIVRGLRAGPDGQFPIGVFDGYGGVLLDGEMRAALVEKSVFEDFVGFGEGFFNVAEFEGDAFVDVAFLAVVVNAGFRSGQGFFRIGDGGEDFVVDIDEVEGFEGGELFAGDDGGNRIADVADVINAESLLVLADGKDSVCDGEVFSGENQIDAGMGESAGSIDLSNPRVGVRGAQEFAVGHAREKNVVSEAGLAGDFGAGVDAAARDADDAKFISVCRDLFRWLFRQIFLIRQVPS
jgi:hypothetical protein